MGGGSPADREKPHGPNDYPSSGTSASIGSRQQYSRRMTLRRLMMALSPTLKNVLNEMTSAPCTGVAGVAGVAENTCADISTHCGDVCLPHHEKGQGVAGVA